MRDAGRRPNRRAKPSGMRQVRNTPRRRCAGAARPHPVAQDAPRRVRVRTQAGRYT